MYPEVLLKIKIEVGGEATSYISRKACSFVSGLFLRQLSCISSRYVSLHSHVLGFSSNKSVVMNDYQCHNSGLKILL